MEQLWDMLLKSSLEREDVANLEQVGQVSYKTELRVWTLFLLSN